MRVVVLLLALAGASLLALPAAAETWPAKPVRVVVSFPAGSTPDLVARVVTPGLSEALGQPVVVDNKSGAAGNIGADAVAKAAPDGYTLLVSTNGPVAINRALYDTMPYDPARDLAPITLLVRAPQIFTITPSLPVADFGGFVAHAKANPQKLSYGSIGSGSAGHLTFEELKFRAGIDLVHVPYRGFPAVVGDLVTGQIQATCAIGAAVLPQIREGKLKGLAITTAARSEVAPDLPSVAALGHPELESYAWIGLLAPTGTPPEIVARLNRETVAILRRADVRDSLMRQGYEVMGDTPEGFGAFIRAETTKWTAVIQRTGAKVEQ